MVWQAAIFHLELSFKVCNNDSMLWVNSSLGETNLLRNGYATLLFGGNTDFQTA